MSGTNTWSSVVLYFHSTYWIFEQFLETIMQVSLNIFLTTNVIHSTSTNRFISKVMSTDWAKCQGRSIQPHKRDTPLFEYEILKRYLIKIPSSTCSIKNNFIVRPAPFGLHQGHPERWVVARKSLTTLIRSRIYCDGDQETCQKMCQTLSITHFLKLF